MIDKIKFDFPAVFSQDNSESITGIKAQIVLKPNARLSIHKDYTIPFFLRDKTGEMLTEMEKDGGIERVHYPKCASPNWPTRKSMKEIDDLLVFLSGLKYFTVLDLTDAFNQLEVTEESKDILTVNTMLGFFRFKRLVYGQASAAPLFQSTMDVILKDLRNVKAYIDDIIIKAESKEELLKLTDVKYLGHIVDKNGVNTLPSKISAIVEAPAPNDVTELRAFLGMVRYYSRFVPRLSEILETLNKRLGKVACSWDKEAQMAFDFCKQKMAHHTMLIHFDIRKPTVLICDASPKEALAVVTGVTTFHEFLYGVHFILLVTDNKAVSVILNPEKGLPVHAHDRLIRLPVKLAALESESANLINVQSNIPINAEIIAAETLDDPILSVVLSYDITEWQTQVSEDLVENQKKKSELCIENGCLLWGNRVIIPGSLRPDIMQLVHKGHPGMHVKRPTSHIVADNEPPFKSAERTQFCVSRNIVLLHSPPYHPPSNVIAERAVQTAKKALRKMLLEGTSDTKVQLVQNVITFLQTYRNTPCSITGISPSQLMVAFKPKTVLNSINPVMSNLSSVNVPNYRVNEKVLYRAKKGESDQTAVIHKILGKNTYVIKIDDKLHLVSVNQLNHCEEGPSIIHDNISNDHDNKQLYEELLKMQASHERMKEPVEIPKRTPNERKGSDNVIPNVKNNNNVNVPVVRSNVEQNVLDYNVNDNVQGTTKNSPMQNVNVSEIRKSPRTPKPNLIYTKDFVTK
ncbi:Retrovirus-related Pol polyprotein from transposon 297 [Frankliniella fusca]|uniref:RNA-directed DNA polymerase n=1 Tax=Frankliniella fusca TaxID=407009 RepID=A0AAE1I332_9NEOP|nr:Retrovirus-related Pol polyprotein from transposon 297 [Frankliniella fusca]